MMSLSAVALLWAVWRWWCLVARSMCKWFLRRFTRLCELQRICYGQPLGAPRIMGVERSLAHSRAGIVQQLVAFLDSLASENKFGGEQLPKVVESTCLAICKVKRVNLRSHARFKKTFSRCVEAIWSYRQLVHEVEWLRRTPYDSGNAVHEHKLCCLWRDLVPDRPLEARVSQQWGDVGFQGDDPATDFRGMGLLGLENLLYFARMPSGVGRRVLSRSRHPKHGYSFAIVGINLTHMALEFLRTGEARSHLYNVVKNHDRPFLALDHFHAFYAVLFEAFDRLWHSERPRDVMEFGRIADKFRGLVRAELARGGDSMLRPSFIVQDTDPDSDPDPDQDQDAGD